jgi:hypothetical protein
MYPSEYRIFRARSCSHSTDRPVSSTELIGGGVNNEFTDGLTRGLFITPPTSGCSVKMIN